MHTPYQYATKLYCVFFNNSQEPVDVYAMDQEDMLLTLKENIEGFKWHHISHIEEHSCPTAQDAIH